MASVPVSLRRGLHVDAHWTKILPCQQLGVDLGVGGKVGVAGDKTPKKKNGTSAEERGG